MTTIQPTTSGHEAEVSDLIIFVFMKVLQAVCQFTSFNTQRRMGGRCIDPRILDLGTSSLRVKSPGDRWMGPRTSLGNM
jgi:hypothetical protein